MGIVANCAFYGLLLYFMGKAYWYYRKNGGLRGTEPRHIPGGKVGSAVAKGAKAGAKMLERKIDEDNAYERMADLEDAKMNKAIKGAN